MAERRMFAKTIIDSDAFLDMPISARLLYYDLAMRADDDGFINSPKKIMRIIGATQDDLNILILRKFIIPFETGVVVIKHWKIHNYIAKDRYTETKYKEEKAQLILDENNSYTNCIHPVDNMETQVRLGKDRLDKVSIGKDIETCTPKNKTEEKIHFAEFVAMTNDEHEKLIIAYGKEFTDQCITALDNYKGANGKKYKSDYRAILNWVIDKVKKDYKIPIQEVKQESEDYSNLEWDENHPLYDFAFEDGGYSRALAKYPNKKICKGDERFG